MIRPGLRLQILLLLGGLLVVTFVPLFYAIRGYANVAFSQVRNSHLLTLGRTVAAQVADAAESRELSELPRLLAQQQETLGVLAIAVLDAQGHLVAGRGHPDLLASLGSDQVGKNDRITETTSDGSQVTLVSNASADRWVVIAHRAEGHGGRSRPLVRLAALYMGLIALALLVLAYFALTRLIVKPLDDLTRAARQVAAGARRLHTPGGARELVELGNSLVTMTERLISEEEALRRKVEEVERTTDSLKRAQDNLIRSERLASVGRLAAGLAHEVGNPITAMIGMQDLLLSGGVSASEQRDFIQRLRNETERIHRILSDLLEFARPGSLIPTQKAQEPGDVAAAVEDTLTLVEPQRSMRDVNVHTELERELPLVVLGREQLQQVVLNLVLNAVDAGARNITIRATAETDETVRIDVSDDGSGVDPKVVEQLFEPFVTTKEVGKGTGLGLAVCRGLIEAQGGHIDLEGEFTPGTRFVIQLPTVPRDST